MHVQPLIGLLCFKNRLKWHGLKYKPSIGDIKKRILTLEGREGGGGGHNPISHQKFFQNPSPSWIFIKNPSQSYQNPSE